jgi:hypothetical protein
MAMSPEPQFSKKHLAEFVEKLRAAAGNNLVSVILFGSAVAGDFHAEYSDLNLFCVLRDASFPALLAVVPVARWWDKRKQPPPLIMALHELERSTDVFAIELMDMRRHHRVIFGEDVLQGLSIPNTLHRVQLEYELREKLSLLRRHLLLASGNNTRMWELLTQSVSSFVTLFRHGLIAMNQEPPAGKRETVTLLADKLGFDASGFLHVLDVRERRIKAGALDAADVFSRYLVAIEHVTAAVDRMLDSGNASSA